MKHISIKTAQMRLIATLLLILGIVSAHAQYYMNIRQTDGTQLRYAVSFVDSVWFDYDVYEYVDLGLSVKWATCNVGAEKPEDYGDYYAWGETETKSTFDDSTYKYFNGSYMTKYCDYGGNIRWTDKKTKLDESDDVAHVKWGGSWRMPTQAEFTELLNNCTWTWTTQNGVNGYLVTSKMGGYTDRSIFLPAAGHRDGASLNNAGSRGCYWSSSLDASGPNYACILSFDYSGSHSTSYGSRDDGQSVRPVCPSEEWLSHITLSMVSESMTLFLNDNGKLTANIFYDNEPYSLPVTILWSSDNPSVATVDDKGNVFAKSIGTANITATFRSISAQCTINVVDESEIAHECVDLGLSVKWATFNVGATTPEEYGGYFAWGETGTKSDYGWSTYKYCIGSNSTMTKYCSNSSYGYNGFTDSKTTLEMSDDVARQKWGGSWRMPTKDEFTELLNNCTWTWTTLNGVNGYQVTSNKSGYTDRSIFLPAAGFREDTSLGYAGSGGYYCSSSLNASHPDDAWRLYFNSGNRYTNSNYRHYGRSVRPVCPSEEWLSHVTVSMALDSMTLCLNSIGKLTANIFYDNEQYSLPIKWSSDNPSVATVDDNGIVTAVSIGTANIKAAIQSKYVQCTVTVIDESEISHECVDLGLSVKWATFNVGATIPEQYGSYYAWGETETKSTYIWSTYKYCQGSSSTLTKYNNSSSYGRIVDGKSKLDESDDVAHVKWGGNWRMPTKDEFTELLNNCTWTYVTLNGVDGYRVTSNKSGYTDRSIFLPAAGQRHASHLTGTGSHSYYWSRSLDTSDPDYAWYLYYSGYHGTYGEERYYGLSVRPVCP